MKLEVTKKLFYFFCGIIVILICIAGVNAYNSIYGDPEVFGHTLNEIEGLDSMKFIHSGFCVFSVTETSCPSGFEEKEIFNERTILSANRYDSTSGSNFLYVGSVGGLDNHTHNIITKKIENYNEGWFVRSISESSNWPPYVNVIMCCKN